MDRKSRYRGAMLGLAAGDALGTTLEFKARDTYEWVTDMVGGGPFQLSPGEWTDDASMALCLAESLVEVGDFDPFDQMERYCRWKNEGHLSSNGICFDIGNTVRGALETFERRRADRVLENPREAAFCGPTDPRTAGNGSLMRLAPVPLFFGRETDLATKYAGESSRTTHGARQAIDACRLYAQMILRALEGSSKEEVLGFEWKGERLEPAIEAIAYGSWRNKERAEIQSSGYVLHTLEAAIWAFGRSSDFREGALLAVNLGGDADTTGAVYGQLAGAFYGEEGLPESWREKLARRELIESFADRLCELARRGRGDGMSNGEW